MELQTQMEMGASTQGGRGILRLHQGRAHVENDAGRQIVPGLFWVGWTPWLGKPVRWFLVPAVEPPCSVVIPDELDQSPAPSNKVEVIFLHRLRGQLVSLFGHIAIIIGGRAWNFSAILAENETISVDEFFWRPCLPPFVPEGITDFPASLHRAHRAASPQKNQIQAADKSASDESYRWAVAQAGLLGGTGSGPEIDRDNPVTAASNIEETRKSEMARLAQAALEGPRADRYGRRFMRSMDIISIAGLAADALAALEESLDELIGRVEVAAVRSKHGESPYFSPWKLNCAGFVREAFRMAGLGRFRSHLPRDLFVEIEAHFYRMAADAESQVVVTRRHLPQVIVPGIRPSSSAVPLMNPLSWWRLLRKKLACKTKT